MHVPGAIPKLGAPSPSWYAPTRNQQEYYVILDNQIVCKRSTTIQSPLPETSQHRPYHTGSTPQINKPAGYAGLYNYDFSHSHGGLTLQ